MVPYCMFVPHVWFESVPVPVFQMFTFFLILLRPRYVYYRPSGVLASNGVFAGNRWVSPAVEAGHAWFVPTTLR
jgi:hypothetical protein